MLAEVQRLPVTTFAHWPLLAAALDWPSRSSDGLRLPLSGAAETRSVMVTADRRFHEVVGASVWADRIVWIEDVT